jgi:hypothetical protein
MRSTSRKLALAFALAVVLSLAAGHVSAQTCFVPAPVVSYYAAPAVSYYAAPAPVVSYYAPPTVSYYAAPAPVVSYYAAPAPVVAPAAYTTTYRYGLFGRRQVSYTSYYPSVAYYP